MSLPVYAHVQLPPCFPPDGPEFNMDGAYQEVLESPSVSFPQLHAGRMAELMDTCKTEQKEHGEDGEYEEMADMAFKRCVC